MFIMTILERLLKVLRDHPTNRLAAVKVFSMWVWNVKSELISTPRSLRWDFSSIGVLSGDMYWPSGLKVLPGQNLRHSNLSALNVILTSVAQL